MPSFGVYDPGRFGWSVPDASDILPFSVSGVSFPAGVHHVAVPAFTALVNALLNGGYVPGGLQSPGCWGYEYRPITGSTSGLSFHAYGLAVDINAPQNGYRADGSAGPHSIKDSASALAHSMGFEWGGAWQVPKDYMHFELHLSPSEAKARYPLVPPISQREINMVKFVRTSGGSIYRINVSQGTAFHLPNNAALSQAKADLAADPTTKTDTALHSVDDSYLSAYYILGS